MPPSVSRALLVAGARPNFIKVKPVLDALERRGVSTLLVHTGQHYDAGMSDVFFADLCIRAPDVSLEVGSGSHAVQTGRVMAAFEPVVDRYRPDVVIVVGDVNSTVACAIVAAKAGSLVAHVEAGLRSRDWSMPEEVNRVVTDRVSDYLLAPSADAVANLRREGYRPDQVFLVGNVMADSLLANIERARAQATDIPPSPFGLVTMHRPANVDDDVTLAGLLDALGTVARRCPLVFPVHPRTRARLSTVPSGITLRDPVGYLDFLALESAASLVLTDSGGVQEETTVLGVPCLTLRENTERPITVEEGTNRVVGRDAQRIVAAATDVLDHRPVRRRPALWDGHAGERIAEVLLAGGSAHERLRPTALSERGSLISSSGMADR